MTDTSKLRYAKTHEWASLNGRVAVVGISDHAQKEISDVVFVELPKIGRQVRQGESVMVVESVKAAFDIYAPLSGKVTKVNEKLAQSPDLVNRSPYGEGWLFELECSDPKEFDTLMNEAAYKSAEAGQTH
jgi:glycine cleavage system H protein